MESSPDGAVDPRTGKVCGGYPNWTTHANNPVARTERPPVS